MYENPAYQANESLLRARGVQIVGPGVGELACGEEGAGRMADVEEIVDAVEARLAASRALEGVRVLVTAGPTREHLDPMRFLSNPSSGKMGFALAERAARMGGRVTVVAGPVDLPAPPGVERIDVVSAEQMHDAVAAHSEAVDIAIFAAAVADYTPERTAKHKIKKSGRGRTLGLRPTPDIARAFGERKRADQVSVGFAADTEKALESARRKMKSKKFDLVVANPLRPDDNVFGSDHNRGWLIGTTGRARRLERMTKAEMAGEILQHAVKILHQKRGA
jgi:phosphopantothenoylcysteine decarboxylase/phosphopantothenate--cysteine ligase